MQRAYSLSILSCSFPSLNTSFPSFHPAEKKSRFGRFARDKSIILASRVANSLLFLSLLMLLLLLLLLLENRNWLAIVTRPSSKLNCTLMFLRWPGSKPALSSILRKFLRSRIANRDPSFRVKRVISGRDESFLLFLSSRSEFVSSEGCRCSIWRSVLRLFFRLFVVVDLLTKFTMFDIELKGFASKN